MSRAFLGLGPLAGVMLSGALLASCEERPRRAETATPPPASAPSKPPAPPPQLLVIPAAFHGEWHLRLEDCGSSSSDGRLVITGDQLTFHESSGEAVSIVSEAAGLTVRAVMNGEGETWEETYRFLLSPDRNSLVQPGSGGGDGVRRIRCPATAPG